MKLRHDRGLKLPFIYLFLLLSALTCSNAEAQQAPVKIPRYGMLELSFQAQVIVDNPFTDYLLKVKLTAPDGQVLVIDGFFAGDSGGGQAGKTWKARISPDQPGKWRWELVAGDVEDSSLVGQNGDFECVDTGLQGGIRVKGRFFQLQNGEPIFLQGNFLDFSNNLISTHVLMSSQVSENMRQNILKRQLEQRVNKINVYLANKGDYQGIKVWPWLGNDFMRMDLQRWADFDRYISMLKSADLFAELWFFADDSGFGKLEQREKNQLFRYAMARTSAFNHTFYIIALEWQEGWSLESVRESGNYIQRLNPWKRLLSVHNLPFRKADSVRSFFSGIYDSLFGSTKYSDEPWADFIASQAGNGANPEGVNGLAVEIARNEQIPHLSEEFGILEKHQDQRLMRNMWANFLGGAAGGGTGSNIASLMNFLDLTRLPFQRMQPANHLCMDGGEKVFCATEPGRHYLVYSMGVDIEIDIKQENFQGYWYDPMNVDSLKTISQPEKGVFLLPDKSKDWVLWLTKE